MVHQSRIQVWYQIASQKVILGEALSSERLNVLSLWRTLPHERSAIAHMGYRLSLFDDDGREIGDKSVSTSTVDSFLLEIKKTSV
ncbi:30S ribosomal protein S6 modification protein [Vibrio sinensis]|uniref:30S ribosomal protein S6 modification protein n=1 Tax=Vibrio sinensis TaxID=2302434 RepID=A0A3A6Q886_9VIBR|nr:30S ribosomal protein S6 modification protein [Vibrio sinensis]RJX65788.1 30S ribosomal protein S6 modification protein [Vibrio sinensis]